ncbi:MAG: aldo/keto reductase [Candidatus Brocadiia bacterium]
MGEETEDIEVLHGAGGTMPALGFGTWALRGDTCRRAVGCALKVGYRHVDTAEMYGNEEAVGDALRESDVPREDIFLVTKVSQSHLSASGVRRALGGSLEKLQTDYVDLLLIHWPSTTGVPVSETLGTMAELREQGKVRHVGVSNFNVALMEEAQEVSPAPVFCNQVEYHPYLSQEPVLECCRSSDILLVSYCPIARGRVFDDPVLQEIGEAHGKSAGQVTLRWHLQQPGVAAIPRSGSPDHIRENFDVFDFELSDKEMGRIFDLQRGERYISGSAAPDWDT